MLEASRIQGTLPPNSLFCGITCLNTTASTNAEVKQLIAGGAPEGLVVTSLRQEGGYGRQGRYWTSPEGGLYLSALLRPSAHGVAPCGLPSLSLAVALAVYDTLQSWGPDETLAIKWPNDVVCSRGKLCGISLEVINDAVCIGIGINVYAQREQVETKGIFPAAYLEKDVILLDCDSGLNAQQKQVLENLAASLLKELEARYLQWAEFGFEAMRDTYSELAFLSDRFVQIASRSGAVVDEGVVAGVDTQGNLVLRDAHGHEHAVASGEAHILL